MPHADLKLQEPTGDTVKNTTCYMCACRSGIKVHLKNGRVRAAVKFHAGTARGTVWTWNAIGKRQGAWKLSKTAPELRQGFLLNHAIDDLLAPREDGYRYANADPVTSQAAWFNLRVRLVPAADPASDSTSAGNMS